MKKASTIEIGNVTLIKKLASEILKATTNYDENNFGNFVFPNVSWLRLNEGKIDFSVKLNKVLFS